MADRRVFFALVALAAGPSLARAERDDPTAELNAERDALIEKITRGTDWDASVKRFAMLVQKRDAVVATSFAAKEHEKQERDQVNAERDARRALREAYHKTNDYEVSWRCTLSPDPAHPIASTEGRFRPDWGKVIRKEQIRLAPKNELDEGEPATMYEVAGVARRYVFRGDKFDAWRKPFVAAVGDLVLVCDGGEDTDKKLPPGWGPRVLTSGFAVRLARPPLIVKKTKWNPFHVTGTVFFWAIHDVKWKFPPGSFVLSNIEVGKDLGGGRWEIDTNNNLSWILEVPPALKSRELVQPGHELWVILGNPRFDKGLKKLVLVAEDLEARYVFEP